MTRPAPPDAGAVQVHAALGVIQRTQNRFVPPGTESFVSVMALGLAGPESLIAAGERPADLAYIRVERGELRIGALTRRTEVAYSPLVSEHCSVLGEAIRADSGRTRGGPATIGASLCRYRATGGVRDALSAAHASVIIRSRQGGRIVPVREFGRPGSPPVSPRELLTEVRIPIAAAGRPGRS